MSGFTEGQVRVATRPLPSTQWSPIMALSCTPAWLADTRRSISRLAQLEDGWDGGEGPAPRRVAIDAAARLLEEMERYHELPIPSVGPTVGGGLGLEWRYGSRDLDLEVFPDGSIEYLRAERKPEGFDANDMEDGPIAPDDLRKSVRTLVLWLMQGV